jgi:hypothetical protein
VYPVPNNPNPFAPANQNQVRRSGSRHFLFLILSTNRTRARQYERLRHAHCALYCHGRLPNTAPAPASYPRVSCGSRSKQRSFSPQVNAVDARANLPSLQSPATGHVSPRPSDSLSSDVSVGSRRRYVFFPASFQIAAVRFRRNSTHARGDAVCSASWFFLWAVFGPCICECAVVLRSVPRRPLCG